MTPRARPPTSDTADAWSLQNECGPAFFPLGNSAVLFADLCVATFRVASSRLSVYSMAMSSSTTAVRPDDDHKVGEDPASTKRKREEENMKWSKFLGEAPFDALDEPSPERPRKEARPATGITRRLRGEDDDEEQSLGDDAELLLRSPKRSKTTYTPKRGSGGRVPSVVIPSETQEAMEENERDAERVLEIQLIQDRLDLFDTRLTNVFDGLLALKEEIAFLSRRVTGFSALLATALSFPLRDLFVYLTPLSL